MIKSLCDGRIETQTILSLRAVNNQSCKDINKRDSGSNDDFSFSDEEKCHKESVSFLSCDFNHLVIKLVFLIKKSAFLFGCCYPG